MNKIFYDINFAGYLIIISMLFSIVLSFYYLIFEFFFRDQSNMKKILFEEYLNLQGRGIVGSKVSRYRAIFMWIMIAIVSSGLVFGFGGE
jgi:hypothetical protein